MEAILTRRLEQTDDDDDDHSEWKIRFSNRIKRKFAGQGDVEEAKEEEQSPETT